MLLSQGTLRNIRAATSIQWGSIEMESFKIASSSFRAIAIATLLALTGLFAAGCGDESGDAKSNDTTAASTDEPKSESTDEVEGVEKMKPAAGTGNVQGKVMFNGKPAANIEVTLCEKFNRFMGGCDGATLTARTDENGEYVITNVAPKEYESLLAAVFDTDSFVFATQGIGGLTASKYNVEADKTLFVRTINLFKSDLKTSSPKAGAKIAGTGIALAWDAYPDAAYYKFSMFPDSMSITSPYINHRVDSAGYALDKPLEKGGWRWEVEAFNGDDIKLSESSNDLTFTVN